MPKKLRSNQIAPSVSNATRNSLKLSSLTIFSRILGLIRDHFQAIFFGTGPIAFAWELAILLPGVLRSILVEGGVAQAFVPIYTASLEGSKKEARRIAGAILSIVFIMMMLCTFLTFLASPHILQAISRQSPDEADFMVRLSWILLLFMLPASLTAILAGISNAHEHFVMPALSPILLNIGLIIGFLSLDIGDEPRGNAKALAWFLIFSAILQFLIQYVYVWRSGFAPKLCLELKNPVVHKIFYMIIPAVLSTAIFHINQLVDISIASYFIPPEVGGVPALRFAQRLVLLPTGVVGVALSTAILPILARCLARKGEEKQDEVGSALHFATFLTIPATLGLFLLGEDIINLLFYGGNWDERSTQVTWKALRYYLLGIPFYSLNKILLSVFFAFKDTKSPLRLMIFSVSCNVIMNIIFVQTPMQHAGIALSTAISSAIYFTLLLFRLQKKHMSLPWAPTRAFLRRSFPLWFSLLGFLVFIDSYLSNFLYGISTEIARSLGLGEEYMPRYKAFGKIFLGVGGGFLFYMFLAFLTKTKEIEVFLSFFRKKKKEK